MRIVVFTGNPHLETTPWWPIVLRTAGLEGILVCRLTYDQSRAAVLRRLRANVRKHGWIFIPYRVLVLAGTVLSRLIRGPAADPPMPPAPVPVDEIESQNLHNADTLVRVAKWNPDLGLSLGAPVLKPALFTIPRLGTVNLHLGKAPDYRGAPPGFWELYTGANEVGATVHWINEGLDTGNLIAQSTAPLYPHDTLAQVESRLMELGMRVFSEALPRVVAGAGEGRPQPPGGRTFRFPTLRQRMTLWARLQGRRWRRVLSPRALLKLGVTLWCLWIWRPVRDLARALRRRHPVRVFTFHRVTDLCRDGMTVPRDVFRRQIDYIAAHHDIVDIERAISLATSGTHLARPAAALTFDDGYRTVLSAAAPELAERGVPGCVFICSGLVGTDRRFPHDEDNPVRPFLEVLSWAELNTLRETGWSLGGHTANHARLSACSGEELGREIRGPLDALREHFGLHAYPMAYPFGQPGDITEAGVRAVREAGFSALLSDFGGENGGGDPFQLRRIEIGGDHATLSWKLAAHGIELRRARERFQRRTAS